MGGRKGERRKEWDIIHSPRRIEEKRKRNVKTSQRQGREGRGGEPQQEKRRAEVGKTEERKRGKAKRILSEQAEIDIKTEK